MEIRLIGSASFLVTSAAGTVVTDPAPETLSDSALNDENAIALFSRQGGIVSNFPDSLTILDGPGEYEVSGVSVFGIPTPAAADASVTREVTTQYVIDADGISVCSLGFIGSIPEARALRAAGNIDVVLVPTIDDSPMSAEQLAAAVRIIDPKVVVPSGFDGEAGKPGEELRRFVGELGAKPDDPAPRLTLSRSNLPEEMRVVILQPRRAGAG